MSERIILEFLSSEQCRERCEGHDRSTLLNSFEKFREEWVEKMINYVIGELGIDDESAKHVRRNPAGYKVNYETFKLLDFK